MSVAVLGMSTRNGRVVGVFGLLIGMGPLPKAARGEDAVSVGVWGVGSRTGRVFGVFGVFGDLTGIARPDSTLSLYCRTFMASSCGKMASKMNYLIWIYEILAKSLMHQYEA